MTTTATTLDSTGTPVRLNADRTDAELVQFGRYDLLVALDAARVTLRVAEGMAPEARALIVPMLSAWAGRLQAAVAECNRQGIAE